MSETLEAEIPGAEIPEPTWLYRVWGEADLLLYIGISKNFGRRWEQHAKKQPWWEEMKRLTADEWFGSRPEAKAAETAAIKAEHPKYNKKHNRQPQRTQSRPTAVTRTPLRPVRIPLRDYAPGTAPAGPRHPYLRTRTELLLADPALAESAVTELPEEGRRQARLRIDSWRLNDDITRTALRTLAGLQGFEQEDGMAAFAPQVRKIRASLMRLAEVSCFACDGKPPAGMACGECGTEGPSRFAGQRVGAA